jgi:hypothetical protein
VGGADDDLKRRSFLAGVAVWGLAVLGLAAAPMVMIAKLGGSQVGAMVWSGVSVIYFGVVAGCFVRRRVAAAAACMGGGLALLAAILFAAILPGIAPLGASRWIGAKLNDLGAGGNTRVAMIDYREPSLAFYQGGGARETDVSALNSPTPPDWAVMTTAAWGKLMAATQNGYGVMNDPKTVLIYNDGWKIVQLIIIHRNVQ